MKILKLFSSKWFFILIFILMIGLIIYLAANKTPPPNPSFYEILTDRTQYYVKELLDLNHKLYLVMFDEVEADLNGFYLVISLVGLSVIILTLQIIAAITRLPLGYLAYPGKFLVINKSKVALIQVTPNKEGETE